MSQIALPLGQAATGRLVVGNANRAVVEAFSHTGGWPFGTAVLFGPPRSGKSSLAAWFAAERGGEAIDDADRLDEALVFHRWNEARARAMPLLLVAAAGEWRVALPDLASRLGAALRLDIGAPDDAMLARLVESHAAARGLNLGEGAPAYLAARIERSHVAAERVVAAIDRLSLERKAPPGPAIWRAALEEGTGEAQGDLL